MQIRFQRLPSVEDGQGLKKSAIYERVKAGLFPKPVPLGGKAVAWIQAEVEAVSAARVAGRTDAEVRALVSRLHEARKSADRAVAA